HSINCLFMSVTKTLSTTLLNIFSKYSFLSFEVGSSFFDSTSSDFIFLIMMIHSKVRKYTATATYSATAAATAS
ncbi:MAG: hypothetical protein KAV70_06770, partial [Bacteroidales bacterium]|nr:hypothetical protein [Bacteroidales bacterium]